MKLLKKFILPFGCCVFLLFLLVKISSISNVLAILIETKDVTPIEEVSPYKKNEEFLFVQNAKSFVPLSKGDLKNIFYTIVNSGWTNFTFYCPNEYKECLSDMKALSQDQDLLTHINNYVHPYLSFSNIKTSLSESGEITIQVERLYEKEQINIINQKIESFMKENITDDLEIYDKIMLFHDAIINQTKYDVRRNESGESNYHSYIAYGPLIEGFATCNGYTDVMAIYLSQLEIPNYKIATTPTNDQNKTEGHVWNAVKVNDEWLHLDLTWDDPVSNDGKDYLQHKYFLVNNEKLKKADEGEVEVLEHRFDSSIYLEFLLTKEN